MVFIQKVGTLSIINPFTDETVCVCRRYETFILWYHFWQCPLELGSVWAEMVGQGEVGGCTQRVQASWSCLGSALERPWLALGGPFFASFAQTGWETVFLPCRAPICGSESLFSPVWLSGSPADSLAHWKFINGYVWFESRTCAWCLGLK